MAFSLDVVAFSPLSVGLLVGAVVFFLLAMAIAARYGFDRGVILVLSVLTCSALFVGSIAVFSSDRTDQAEAVTDRVLELPGVDSFLLTESDYIPVCNIGSQGSRTAVNVITEDGESVDGHLIVSEPKDGTCTYELKLPTK